MLATANTFVLSILLGVVVGGITAYFTYGERGRAAAVRTFVGWLLAFAITGVIAPPIARWILENAL